MAKFSKIKEKWQKLGAFWKAAAVAVLLLIVFAAGYYIWLKYFISNRFRVDPRRVVAEQQKQALDKLYIESGAKPPTSADLKQQADEMDKLFLQRYGDANKK